MNKQNKLRPVLLGISAGVALTLASVSTVQAASSSFSSEKLASGYQLADSHNGSKADGGKCGAGKCGAAKCGSKKANGNGDHGKAKADNGDDDHADHDDHDDDNGDD